MLSNCLSQCLFIWHQTDRHTEYTNYVKNRKSLQLPEIIFGLVIFIIFRALHVVLCGTELSTENSGLIRSIRALCFMLFGYCGFKSTFRSLTSFYFNSCPSIFFPSFFFYYFLSLFYTRRRPGVEIAFIFILFLFFIVLYVSSYRWVHFSRAVLFCQPHRQLFTHSLDNSL